MLLLLISTILITEAKKPDKVILDEFKTRLATSTSSKAWQAEAVGILEELLEADSDTSRSLDANANPGAPSLLDISELSEPLTSISLDVGTMTVTLQFICALCWLVFLLELLSRIVRSCFRKREEYK